jgi:glyoxylase-like metal-dependent hydrolase (beta-lactamase superfamily II)
MSDASVRRELGRGERVLPGLWRLRLPLPWAGVPHCNAWALAAGDGIVLIDCGMDQPAQDGHPGSLEQLELALAQVGLALEQVTDLVITHAHSDHWGQAATVIERTGAKLWMHPNHAHGRASLDDPEAALNRRFEVGRQSGVPEAALTAYFERVRQLPSGIAGAAEPDHLLVNGVTVATDHGPLVVHETPGHAPSHVCLYQPDRRLLISGDHLLGRISLYFDYGWTPDPIAEFLAGLDLVDALDVRLCVSGHGRPFTDIAGHVTGNRALVAQRLAAAVDGLRAGPLAAIDVVPAVFGERVTPLTAAWHLNETLCLLTHLEHNGLLGREPDGAAERWRLIADPAQP